MGFIENYGLRNFEVCPFHYIMDKTKCSIMNSKQWLSFAVSLNVFICFLCQHTKVKNLKHFCNKKYFVEAPELITTVQNILLYKSAFWFNRTIIGNLRMVHNILWWCNRPNCTRFSAIYLWFHQLSLFFTTSLNY